MSAVFRCYRSKHFALYKYRQSPGDIWQMKMQYGTFIRGFRSIKSNYRPLYLNVLVYPKIPVVPVRSSTCCFSVFHAKRQTFLATPMFSLPKLEQGENLATSKQSGGRIAFSTSSRTDSCAEKFEIDLKNTAFCLEVKGGKTGVKGPEGVFSISSHQHRAYLHNSSSAPLYWWQLIGMPS